MAKINVKQKDVIIIKIKDNDYISLTDIAKYKSDEPAAVIANWLRNRNTIEYLGIWETLYNPDFKPLEFEEFKVGIKCFYALSTKMGRENCCNRTYFKIRQIWWNFCTIVAKEWRDTNPELKCNIRDYNSVNELIWLSNLENISSVLINEGVSQSDRLIKLNRIAIQQMKILQDVETRKLF